MSNTLYVDLYQTKPRLAQRLAGRTQRWRWTARSGDNQEILAVTSESYLHRQDAVDAIFLLFGDDANVYMRAVEHGNVELRLAKPL